MALFPTVQRKLEAETLQRPAGGQTDCRRKQKKETKLQRRTMIRRVRGRHGLSGRTSKTYDVVFGVVIRAS